MTPREQIDAALAKYPPAIAKQLRAVRRHLSGHFPRGFELVYDTSNAIAFGFSPTNRASGALVSVAGYPKWVTLFFLYGKSLADPEGLLEGSGSRVRSVRLDPPQRLHEPAVQALIEQVAKNAAAEFAAAPKRTTVLKSVARTQRSRRPGKR